MSRTPRLAIDARTASSYAAGVVVAALSIVVLASCAADHTQTVPALERERVAADELPDHWVAELWAGGNDTDTSRLIGADPEGFEYYVSVNRNGGYCLVVSADKLDTPPFENPYDTWRANCETSLPFDVKWHHITATLHAHGQAPSGDGNVTVADQVSVRR